MNCPVNVRHQTDIYGVFFMSKFTAEERVQTVLRYLEGNESYNDIEKDLKLGKRLFRLGFWT